MKCLSVTKINSDKVKSTQNKSRKTTNGNLSSTQLTQDPRETLFLEIAIKNRIVLTIIPFTEAPLQKVKRDFYHSKRAYLQNKVKFNYELIK